MAQSAIEAIEIAPPCEQPEKQRKYNTQNIEPHKWKPGQSGNPSGRPKGLVGEALLRQLLKKAAKSGNKTELEQVVAGVVGSAKEGNPKSFAVIRDTIDGRPTQEVVHDIGENVAEILRRGYERVERWKQQQPVPQLKETNS